jgi:hypothetical protein
MPRRNLLKASVLSALLFLSIISFAQDKVITGRVTDSKDGTPVSGVTVSVKGTRNAVQTGSDGSYRITVGPTVTTLIYSSVGFATQEVAIDGKTSVDVSFVVNNSSLGEVIVVGYGTQRRKDVRRRNECYSCSKF